MSSDQVQQLLLDLQHTIQSLATPTQSRFDVAKYLGTPRVFLNISTPQLRKMIKQWKKDHPNISFLQWEKLLTLLNAGSTFQERVAVGYMLEYYPEYRRALNPAQFAVWLEDRIGWGEVDTLCQSTWTAEDFQAKWSTWESTLNSLQQSTNISQRRASLVLLVRPLSQSDDKRFLQQAVDTLSALQLERNVLITKAVSWVLRAMIRHHASEVKKYLAKHREKLPAIAYRETMKKLTTGRKQ